MRQGNCPDPSQLERLLVGEVPTADRDRLLNHLDGCATCVALVETLRGRNPPAAALGGAGSGATTEGQGQESAGAPALAENAVIGRYRVVRKLGEGGMGAVFLAQDPELDRPVAVKVPRFAPADTAAMIRFLREAQAAAKVRHAHVCPVHDVGEHAGRPFLVMAFIEGEPLTARLAGGPLAPAEAVRLTRQIAAALGAIHAHGIIHRDLKPGNVLVDQQGNALLTDFGLARPALAADPLTADGVVLGTPAYVAPEQAAGYPDRLDARTDLYSLGVMLYQLLTGQLPFPERNVLALLRQIQQDDPPAPHDLRPALDPGLEALVLKAMARRPADRFQTAGELVAALDAWTAGLAHQPPTGAYAPRPGGPRPRGWGLAGLAAGVLLAGGWVACQVVIRIRDAAGNVVASATFPEVPKGGSLEVAPAPGSGPPVGPKFSALKLLGQWEGQPGLSVKCVASTPDGRLVLSGGWVLPVTVWDAVAQRRAGGFAGHQDAVWCAAVSPTGQVALSGGGLRLVDGRPQPGTDFSLRLWEVATGKEVRRLEGHTARVTRVAFSADGLRAASCGYDRTLRWWEVATGRQLRVVQNTAPMDSLALSPNGRLALAGDWDGTIKLWDLETGDEKQAFKGHTAMVMGVAFSPDGRQVLSASMDKTLRLWDVAGGHAVRVFPEVPTGVIGLAWSPQGRLAVFASGSKLLRRGGFESAGKDNCLRVWDVPTGQEDGRFENPDGEPAEALALTPDGQKILAGFADGTVRLFAMPAVPAGP